MAFKDLYPTESVRSRVVHFLTEPMNTDGAIYVYESGDVHLEDWRGSPALKISFPSVEEAYAAGVMMGIWNE